MQIFFANIVGYGDTQVYGFAALFGLVTDLNLYSLKLEDGKPTLDTSKYQWTTAIVPLGIVVVRAYLHYSLSSKKK